jgi:hypothetical protein
MNFPCQYDERKNLLVARLKKENREKIILRDRELR